MERAAYTALCGACNVYHAAPCRCALVTQSNKNAALKNLVLQDDLNFVNYANFLLVYIILLELRLAPASQNVSEGEGPLATAPCKT